MTLENKFGITSPVELARLEERLSKARAYKIFEEIYGFAGKIRKVNIAKGNFRFVPVMYLEAVLGNIRCHNQPLMKL